MGDTTDELLGLAAAITEEPDPRELDMLLATGEHQSATLVSMALHALGVAAISLTGAQAGITTDGRHGRARIANVEPRRVRQELEQRQGRDRRRLPGRSARRGERRRARRRRSAAAARTRRPSRSPPRSAPTAARSSPTSAASTRRIPRLVPERPPAAGDRLRGDARARPAGRPGDADPRRRARLGQRRRHRGPQLVRGRARNADHGGSARGAAQQGPRPGPRPERRQGDAVVAVPDRPGIARHACSSRSPRPASTST